MHAERRTRKRKIDARLLLTHFPAGLLRLQHLSSMWRIVLAEIPTFYANAAPPEGTSINLIDDSALPLACWAEKPLTTAAKIGCGPRRADSFAPKAQKAWGATCETANVELFRLITNHMQNPTFSDIWKLGGFPGRGAVKVEQSVGGNLAQVAGSPFVYPRDGFALDVVYRIMAVNCQLRPLADTTTHDFAFMLLASCSAERNLTDLCPLTLTREQVRGLLSETPSKLPALTRIEKRSLETLPLSRQGAHRLSGHAHSPWGVWGCVWLGGRRGNCRGDEEGIAVDYWPASAMNVVVRDGGPSVLITIFSVANSASIAALNARFVMPSLSGWSANSLGAYRDPPAWFTCRP